MGEGRLQSGGLPSSARSEAQAIYSRRRMTDIKDMLSDIEWAERKAKESRERVDLILQGRDPNVGGPTAELPTWEEYHQGAG